MSLDSITLYLVATMVAALLGAMLLFFGRQENSPALKWWGTAYLLGAASVALWTATGDKLGPHLYLALNAVGGGLACLSSVLIAFLPFVVLEGLWCLVALVGLARHMAPRRQTL